MVPRLVVDTKESYVHTWSSEHGDLEFHNNGRSRPWLGTCGWHQIHFGIDDAFGLASKTFHTPNNSLFFWFILGAAKGVLDFGFGFWLLNMLLVFCFQLNLWYSTFDLRWILFWLWLNHSVLAWSSLFWLRYSILTLALVFCWLGVYYFAFDFGLYILFWLGVCYSTFDFDFVNQILDFALVFDF